MVEAVEQRSENNIDAFFASYEIEPLVSLEKMLAIPENSNKSLGVIADLVANNRFDTETEARLKGLQLDGHLIGIGTASIFAMLNAFKECKGFVSMDIHPVPVAIGRVLVELFKSCETFEQFLDQLSSDVRIMKRLKDEGLPAKYLNSAWKSIYQGIRQYKRAVDPARRDAQVDGMHVKDEALRNLFPLGAIQSFYQVFRQLALEDKMHFVQQDFFQPGFWEQLKKSIPQLEQEQNLIYGSNGLDHLYRSKDAEWDIWNQRGKTRWVQDEQEALGTLMEYNFKDWPNSKFVFTLTTLKYQLQLTDKPPHYGFENGELVLKYD